MRVLRGLCFPVGPVRLLGPFGGVFDTPSITAHGVTLYAILLLWIFLGCLVTSLFCCGRQSTRNSLDDRSSAKSVVSSLRAGHKLGRARHVAG